MAATERRWPTMFLCMGAAPVAVLAPLTFMPFKFLHPFRVVRWRALSVAAVMTWSVLAFMAVLRDLEPGPWVAGGLVAVGLYFLGIGITEKQEFAADDR